MPKKIEQVVASTDTPISTAGKKIKVVSHREGTVISSAVSSIKGVDRVIVVRGRATKGIKLDLSRESRYRKNLLANRKPDFVVDPTDDTQ
jgi:hypothetical protein